MKLTRPVSKQVLPESAKCVFKGVLFDVYQWEQQQFDGSSKTFERLKRKDTVNVIPITSEGKIILTKQEQPGMVPFIGSIGGVVDFGEEPLAAAEREFLEEAGMKALKYELWDSRQLSSHIEWVMYTFIARDLQIVGKPQLDSGERIELMEVGFEEFLEVVKSDEYRDREISYLVLKAMTYAQELAGLRNLLSK